MKYIESNIPENCSLRVRHFHDGEGNLTGTEARIVEKSTGDLVGYGLAEVYYLEVGPTRKRGRQIAVGRAFKDAHQNEFSPYPEEL